MKKLFSSKHTWWALGWAVLLIVALLLIPHITTSTSSQIPSSYQSSRATQIQNKWGSKQNKTTSVAVVFNNHNKALTATQNKQINKTIERLKKNKNKYQIKDITDAKDTPLVKSQLISKDKTTQIVELSVKKTNSHTIATIKKELTSAIQTKGVKTYLTGSDVLDHDFSESTEKGVKKTEIIAVIFIFVVLLLVFRSPITPIISLLTVGVSGLISISLVTNLVKYFGFPFSNFSEVFIIIVLFGIGTDYNILLYNEFRSGLTNGLTKSEATRQALKVGGRTIIYSGASVLIGMTTLFFAKFSLYRSAAGIAVGIAILLLVLLTLNPFFMEVMGGKMFWPIKEFKGEKNSTLWHSLAKYSLLRPILTIIAVLIVILPLASQSQGLLNYNDADEVSNSTPSKIGFNLIQKHFSKGLSEPTTIYIKTNKKLTKEKYLQLIDQVTNQLKHVSGVKSVLSATQPGGKKIKSLYVSNQLNKVTTGLAKSQKGLSKISSGLSSAKTQINSSNIQSKTSSVSQLAQGSTEVASGTSELSSGIQQITTAIKTLNSNLSSSISSQSSQLKLLEESLPELNSAINQLNQEVANSSSDTTTSDSLTSIATAATDIKDQLTKIDSSMSSLSSSAVSGQTLVSQLQSAGANLTTDQIQTIEKVVEQNNTAQSQALSTLKSSLSTSLTKIGTDTSTIGNADSTLATQLSSLQTSSNSLKSAISQLATNSNKLLPSAATAITQLSSGLSTLSSNTSQLYTAISTVNSQTSQLVSGASQVATGNQELSQSFTSLAQKALSLSSGLGSASSGINQVTSGSKSMNSYLTGLKTATASKVYYIPQKQLHSKAFKPILDTYFSDSKKITQLTVVLKADPNSEEAIQTLSKLQTLVKGSLKGTVLSNATVVAGGSTSRTKDLKNVASGDFSRTAILMLIGILIALMFVTRSLIQSITIELLLVFVYYSALNIVHWLSSLILGQSMLTWNTPFFAFIMLIALGVDYTIFLVIKFREGLADPISIDAKVLRATSIIGSVVISAGVILSGTFAALIPSGVLTLVQVALVVIVGILLLVLLIPIVMPAVMKITYPTPSSKLNDQSHEKE
ncbi:MMPL family transporter [Ligilactobacillus sp. WILCCON 0076]|uniref:MMPL family transporter n=1 Tax=Ligilactobacillus ubinensis TaxID=2876789 RepID=A0A9X2FL59_9LACO|nr:MMPL family transporter [Ligilactobacillus ubinensis]MCP0887621.1 MMPL family transporter [Ligilactobacillus ubinensis]